MHERSWRHLTVDGIAIRYSSPRSTGTGEGYVTTPEDLKYTEAHEWVRDEGDLRIRVGVTDYAQDQLGDIVYVELPEVGTDVEAGDTLAEIESTKSVGEAYAPVRGTVVKVNDALNEAPELINSDPYGDGWIAVIALESEFDSSGMLDAAGYRALVE